MIHSVGGVYSNPAGWVERIAREQNTSDYPEAGEQRARQALPGIDPEKAASISGLANRSVSYQGAIRSLDDIGAYLEELI